MLSFDIAERKRNQEDERNPLVICTGGGTAGHVVPGLSVAAVLRRHGCAIGWIGGTRGMERELVKREGVPFYGIPVGKLRRYISVENLWDVFRVLAGVLRARSLLRTLRPVAVFSKGGFASVPTVFAAWSLGIPVITHESDSDPGLATRINSRFSRRICVPYPGMEGHFPASIRRRLVTTGNPVRPGLADADPVRGREALGLPARAERMLLLVLGGSQGARQINEAVTALLPSLLKRWDVVHQTGAGYEPARPAEVGPGRYIPVPFVRSGMADLVVAADLVVSRAGAGTLWENAALARPMILMPLVAGSRGDQVRNARRFARDGAAVVIDDQQSLEEDLSGEIERLGDDRESAAELGRRARSLVRLDAGERLAAVVLRVARRQETSE